MRPGANRQHSIDQEIKLDVQAWVSFVLVLQLVRSASCDASAAVGLTYGDLCTHPRLHTPLWTSQGRVRLGSRMRLLAERAGALRFIGRSLGR
jgi:hypothetical protein